MLLVKQCTQAVLRLLQTTQNTHLPLQPCVSSIGVICEVNLCLQRMGKVLTLTICRIKRNIKNALEAKHNFIVASDIAARGIDIVGVSHVISLSLPKNNLEFYTHRKKCLFMSKYLLFCIPYTEICCFNLYFYISMEVHMNKRTEILKQFGRNVKAERVRKGLTQEALAERMNINSEYISKVERGMANMSLKKIDELADYIGADINDLLRF